MKHTKGFSLVELLVGLFISLLVTLTIAGTAQFLDVQRRINLGTNGVLETVATSYRDLSTSINMAGFGVTQCPTITYNTTGAVTTINNQIPIILTANTGTRTDSIRLIYGNSATGAAYSFLTAASDGTSAVTNYAGQLSANDLVLISDSTTCGVFGVNTVAVVGDVTTVTLGKTIRNTTWGDAGGFPSGSIMMGMQELKDITYTINNLALQYTDAVTGEDYPIADNVVMLRGYYGLNDGTFVRPDNTNGDGLDWSAAGLTATPANIARIRSVRVFMVARSPLLNRKNDANVCTTTPNAPTSWVGGPVVDLTGIPDWQCYRYRTADFIVPLKNKLISGV